MPLQVVWRHPRVRRFKDQDSKNRLISVKIRESAEKYTLQSNKPLQLTDSEIYSLREEMRAALEGMEKLELDRQASDALALTETPDSSQGRPQPDGLSAASDGQPDASDTPL